MTEACDAVTDYAFAEPGFERLTLCNAAGNTPSRRSKEKAGATFLRVEPAQFAGPDLTEHEVWELHRTAPHRLGGTARLIIPRPGCS